MKPLSSKRHRFPAEVIRHAVWLYFRFRLSLRDVEELLAARGVEVGYETIRCWTIRFCPRIARRLKKLRPSPFPLGASTNSSARSRQAHVLVAFGR